MPVVVKPQAGVNLLPNKAAINSPAMSLELGIREEKEKAKNESQGW